VSHEKWLLVYNDRGANLFNRGGQIGIPMIIGMVGFLATDYWMTAGKMSYSTLQRLVDDAADFGYFIILPAVAMLFSFSVTLLFQQRYLIRIYQNRENPDSFMVHVANGPFFRKWVETERSQIVPLCDIHASESLYTPSLFLFGHVRIGSKSLFISPGAFRNNQLRTYLLSENDTRPKSLDILDMDLEDMKVEIEEARRAEMKRRREGSAKRPPPD